MTCLNFPLYETINEIRAIDNHSHYPYVIDRESYLASVTEFLTGNRKTKYKVSGGILHPLRNSEYNEIIDIIKELYNFKHDSVTEKNQVELASKMRETWGNNETEDAYVHPLDLSGTEIVLVNNWEWITYLDKNRFKWVPIVDQFIHPIKKSNIRVTQMKYREMALETAYQKHGGKPENFGDYLELMRNELKDYKKKGAVAVKIWSAFFRTLRFQKVDEVRAKQVYARYMSNLPVDESDYKDLQDYLAHRIFSLCKELNLPIQIHTGFGLANDKITLANSSPCNLENIVKDDDYQGLKIVLLHGGYPYFREAGSLALMNDDVFIDSSWLSALIPPSDLGSIFREWFTWKLEDKVLFGTDATDTKYLTGDILHVFSARRARKALSSSLTEMLNDGILNQEEAVLIAEKVLRMNALNLYGL